MNKSSIFFWLARIVAALIMLQTLYFKFSGAPESIYIFTQVGMEPWGRYFVGFMELISSALILLPATVWLGSVIAIGLMAGAVGMHLTILGIQVPSANGQLDGGYLFLLCLVVLISSSYAFWQSKTQIPPIIKQYLPSFLK